MGLSSIPGHFWRAFNKFNFWCPFLPFLPLCIYVLIYFSFRFSFLYLLLFERPNNGIEMCKTAGNVLSTLASHRSFQSLVDTVAGVPAQLSSVYQGSSTPVDWMFANMFQSGKIAEDCLFRVHNESNQITTRSQRQDTYRTASKAVQSQCAINAPIQLFMLEGTRTMICMDWTLRYKCLEETGWVASAEVGVGRVYCIIGTIRQLPANSGRMEMVAPLYLLMVLWNAIGGTMCHLRQSSADRCRARPWRGRMHGHPGSSSKRLVERHLWQQSFRAALLVFASRHPDESLVTSVWEW